MTFDVNEEELTILGISFDNYSDFEPFGMLSDLQ